MSKQTFQKACFKLGSLILGWLTEYHHRYNPAGDIEEEYQRIRKKRGRFRAFVWYWEQILVAVFKHTCLTCYWRIAMIRNYFKIAVRNLKRQKGYSFINITGLAVGIACCLFIFLFVSEELSYDRYHRDKDRLFRMSVHFKTKSFTGHWAALGPGVAPYVKKDYPQVEYAARIFPMVKPLFKKEERMFYEEKAYYADQDLLNIFTIPFIQGNPEGALNRPNTVVLSEKAAEKYFGSIMALGEILIINDESFEVTGIVEDAPSNTHFKYEMLVSMKSYENAKRYFPNWGWTVFRTYIKLAPGIDPKHFEDLIRNFENNYMTEEEAANRSFKNTYFLQPVPDIHLHSHLRGEMETPGNPLYVTMTGVIGLLILLIACINFMNLSTARYSSRAKEVGLRKVVGARRRQLIHQFLNESFLMSLIAFIAAFFITLSMLPLFNDLSGKAFTVQDILQLKTLLVSIILIIAVAVFSGGYPAFCLSTFKPSAILRTGRSSRSGSSNLRKILVVGQFTISIVLLVGTFVVHSQLNFMKNMDLGFDKEQKINISWGNNGSLKENYQQIKAEFLKIPGVTGTTVSSAIPGYGIYGWQVRIVGEAESKQQYFNVCLIDDDFIPEFDITMSAGRPFKKELNTDIAGPLIINETAVKSLGWQSSEEAIGKSLLGGPADGQIIGVMKDFHFSDVQKEIGPMVMVYAPDYFDCVTLALQGTDHDNTISLVKQKWEEWNPDGLFIYRFIDAIYDSFHRSNERTGRLFGLFTFLVIFISCLGLFGLVSYTAEKRTKEIGIRKILGASVPGITTLLVREFIQWIGFSILIAAPIAYFAMERWLQNFAYRTNLSIWIFILSGLAALVIALLTVSYQTIKAATANPVEALRYE